MNSCRKYVLTIIISLSSVLFLVPSQIISSNNSCEKDIELFNQIPDTLLHISNKDFLYGVSCNYFSNLICYPCIEPEIFVEKLVQIGSHPVSNPGDLLGVDYYAYFIEAVYEYISNNQDSIIKILVNYPDKKIKQFFYSHECLTKFVYSLPGHDNILPIWLQSADERIQRLYKELISELKQ